MEMEQGSLASEQKLFEVKVPDGPTQNVIGVGMQSNNETVKYLWSDGVIVSTNDGLVRSEGRCQSGDVISCHICFGVLKYENKHFHRLLFSINGSELNRPIWLEGSLPISVGLIQDADCEEIHNEIEATFCHFSVILCRVSFAYPSLLCCVLAGYLLLGS